VDFTVYLMELGPGPTYVSTESLKVAEGPYTVENACFTAPDLGFTLQLDMISSTLPDYVTVDSSNVSIVADPQSNTVVSESFLVTFTCELTEFVENMGTVEMPVTFTVTENADNSDCPDVTNSDCDCLDPTDLTDPTCPTPDPCPDVTNSDCDCLDPTDLTDPTCPTPDPCPDATNPDCDCLDPTDLTDETCPTPDPCPDATNPDCDCLDPTDLTDETCPTAEPDCPDSTNPDCDCLDPTDLTDTTCPTPEPESDCPDSSNPDCDCLDPTDLTDLTCPTIDPVCPDSLNPECEDYGSDEDDDDDDDGDENEEYFSSFTVHEYYIPSGGGPSLNDYFGLPGTLKDSFVLTGIDQGFDWTFSIRNEDPVDDSFQT